MASSLSSSAMAYRMLEITLVTAKGLRHVNYFSKMAVYAVVFLSGDPRALQRTPADHEGGTNPSWNSTLRLAIPADGDAASGHSLHILLRAERALGHRDVGEVRVPLAELLAGAGDGPRPVQFVSYQVCGMNSGKPKGVLNFSYKLSERVAQPAATPTAALPAVYPPRVTAYPAASTAAAPYPYATPSSSKADEPVMAYPAGLSSAAYPAYGTAPPYPPPAGYHQAQPYGYGYPPVGYGYGYGAAPALVPVVQPQRRNWKGMGLGAGLLGGALGGALGGILIGDMISDAATYDAGYD